ncbi:PREDICTED: uncharacterized protein LOC104783863 [Camelina sativa]|uniref:Uncharacterized protein LOC104783863 n=1 Tax=Camelina sativa TaxID=90675 RepID=A0ABM0YX76_CAMSA|nr:PREDICTED: uncharacterized protein LOC104783863 [Camelina sativa]
MTDQPQLPQAEEGELEERFKAALDIQLEAPLELMSKRKASPPKFLPPHELREEIIKETALLEIELKEAFKEIGNAILRSGVCLDPELQIEENLEDPGSFTLPCLIGLRIFNNYLCNLGASVSIMPLSVANKMGFSSFKPSRRPFLATVGAVIDVKQGKIIIEHGENFKIEFGIKKGIKKPTINGQAFFTQTKQRRVKHHKEVHTTFVVEPRQELENPLNQPAIVERNPKPLPSKTHA